MASAEEDIRATLNAWPAFAALVPAARVVQNAIGQTGAKTPPYVVFTATHDLAAGLSDVALGDVATVELQCWGKTAAEAAAVADAATAALRAAGAPPTGRATGYDPEVGLDAEVLTTVWVTG